MSLAKNIRPNLKQFPDNSLDGKLSTINEGIDIFDDKAPTNHARSLECAGRRAPGALYLMHGKAWNITDTVTINGTSNSSIRAPNSSTTEGTFFRHRAFTSPASHVNPSLNRSLA